MSSKNLLKLDRRLIKRAKRANRYWSEKLGWKLLSELSEEEYADYIYAYQILNDLEGDGIRGPLTHESMTEEKWLSDSVDYIILNGKRHGINQKVVSYNEKNAFSLYDHPGTFKRRDKRMKLKRIVFHWDVTVSAISTFNVLLARHKRHPHIGTHFCINYDGTIYQFLDPIKHATYHASGAWKNSIGIDLNNPVHLSRQREDEYQRPILHAANFGLRLGKYSNYKDGFLGYTPEQLASARDLVSILCANTPIPLVRPKTHELYNRLNNFRAVWGLYGHLNVDIVRKGKWDTIYPQSAWDYICKNVRE